MKSAERSSRSRVSGNLLRRVTALTLLVTLAWFSWVYTRIDKVAREDNAQPADAIAVFGAAEYAGHPSPVLHARLDHAVALYKRQLAPLVITFGGGGDKNSGTTEGGVGRDYLLANGIPYDKIIAETQSVDTEQQVEQLATIAESEKLKRIIVVSDGTHLFRIQALCKEAGLNVYTSPRPGLGHISSYDLFQRHLHEILSYTLLQLKLRAGWMDRWLDNRNNP